MAAQALIPLYVDGDTNLRSLLAILTENGFALRCDSASRLVAEPAQPGAFNLIRRDDLPTLEGATHAA